MSADSALDEQSKGFISAIQLLMDNHFALITAAALPNASRKRKASDSDISSSSKRLKTDS